MPNKLPWESDEDDDIFGDDNDSDNGRLILSIPYIRLTDSSDGAEIVIASDFIGYYRKSTVNKDATIIHCFGGGIISVKETPKQLSEMLGFKG